MVLCQLYYDPVGAANVAEPVSLEIVILIFVPCPDQLSSERIGFLPEYLGHLFIEHGHPYIQAAGGFNGFVRFSKRVGDRLLLELGHCNQQDPTNELDPRPSTRERLRQGLLASAAQLGLILRQFASVASNSSGRAQIVHPC